LGFNSAVAEQVLKTNLNSLDASIDALLEMQNGTDFIFPINDDGAEAGTSSAAGGSSNWSNTIETVKKKMKRTIEEDEKAFAELSNDLEHLQNDDEYLTITLEKEQALLAQYKRALGN